MMWDSMRWSEEVMEGQASSSSSVTNNNNNAGNNSNNNNNGLNVSLSSAASAPTIKNHSVTHLGQYLYCFGGYDGRRNHMTLLLYHLGEKRWIRPQQQQQQPPTESTSPSSDNASVDGSGIGIGSSAASASSSLPLSYNHLPPHHHLNLNHPHLSHHNMNINHHNHHNMNNMNDHAILMQGSPPPGRNGHSATLAADDEDLAEGNGRIIIIGGWLGTGPLAASDMHILDVSRGGRQLTWYQPLVQGTPPGPCNMHSADFVKSKRSVYVFRGGNGREYLNDLHALNVDTLHWKRVETLGQIPQQRANHSSCVLEETRELFIFGGWNGGERLNDIHILNTETSMWTCPRVGGVLPHPRAGMTLTALRGRLYLFGGSGTSAKCFQDLQILDRQQMAWLDVTQYEGGGTAGTGGGDGGNGMVGRPPSPNAGVAAHHHHVAVAAAAAFEEDALFRFGGGGDGAGGGGNGNNNHASSAAPQYGGEDIEQQQALLRPTQDGSVLLTRHQQPPHRTSFTRSQASDWRSRDSINNSNINNMSSSSPAQSSSAAGAGAGSSGTGSSGICPINPNDEEVPPTVMLHGRGPGRRAGHTATAVHRKIYIFGGSCGSDYLNDFYVLDTDPPPPCIVSEPTSLQLLERRLRHFFNDPEFADVVFLVQGQRVYGHKMVLSIVSDCFRAMFTNGFKESAACEIEIPDCSYAGFLAVMEYIYTSQLPACLCNNNNMMNNSNNSVMDMMRMMDDQHHHNPLYHHHHPQQQQPHPTTIHNSSNSNFARVVEMLELADRFFLDHLKQICETLLQPTVQADTVFYLLSVSQRTNAMQLQAICEHFLRNRVETTATTTPSSSSSSPNHHHHHHHPHMY